MNDRRSYHTSRGAPEDLAWIKNKESVVEQTAENNSQEFKELLSKVDFDVLEEIFMEKYGRPFYLKDLNFLRPGRIVGDFHEPHGTIGSYDSELNAIHVYSKALRKDLQKSGDGVSFQIHLLEVITHEETHAISRSACQGGREAESWLTLFKPRTKKIKSGYREIETRVRGVREEVVSSLYEAFDEGVNEKMSREIVLEYLKKTGVSSDMIGAYAAIRKEKGHYQTHVQFVDDVVNDISRHSEVPESQVWRALVGGKLNGESIGQDHKEFFAELFYPSFLQELMRAKSHKDVVRMMFKMRLRRESPRITDEELDTALAGWEEKDAA